MVTHDGKIAHIEPYEEDAYGFHTVAFNIMNTCGLKFTPGQIGNKPVDSFVYFPIEFSILSVKTGFLWTFKHF